MRSHPGRSRAMTPDWESWTQRRYFPMGLALSGIAGLLSSCRHLAASLTQVTFTTAIHSPSAAIVHGACRMNAEAPVSASNVTAPSPRTLAETGLSIVMMRDILLKTMFRTNLDLVSTLSQGRSACRCR